MGTGTTFSAISDNRVHGIETVWTRAFETTLFGETYIRVAPSENVMQADEPKGSSIPLGRNYTMCLETYRKGSQPVRTPVWYIIENGLVYFKTAPKAGKVKRLKRNPAVRMAPCTFGGKILGEWVSGTASFLPPSAESKRIDKTINTKHGIAGWLIGLFEKDRIVYSVTLDSK